ncbi:MAG: septum formation initiator family protein [Mycobacterium sp.]
MADPKRPDKRRSPTSGPGRSGDVPGKPGRPRKTAKQASVVRRDQPSPADPDTDVDQDDSVHELIRQSIVVSAERQSEKRMGFTARRAAVLAAVVCVLTLTIAGPVRTYFAQRTEMSQLIASEAALREQIADLEEQKMKLADPAFIAAQARERLGFVMPGDIPYQVQLPPSAAGPEPEALPEGIETPSGPWYSTLWKTIADDPHGPPLPPPVAPLPGELPPPGEPLPGEPLPPPVVPGG